MEEVRKSNEFVVLHGIPTPVRKCGIWHENKSSHRYLFLVIPGNPGVAEYYDLFMERLYKNSNGLIPAWTLSHTGHAKVSAGSPQDRLAVESCYARSLTLEEQIKVKLEFIRDHVPQDVKLILIGHSIGCYMILRLMDQLDSHHVLRSFLLFPTIERMATSPNGQIMTPLLKYCRWLAVITVKVLSYLSKELQYQLILWHFGKKRVPPCVLSASLGVFDSCCIANMLFLANLEMQQVSDLDEALVKRHISKLSFYYGQKDDWCPQQYYYDMKQKIPHADLKLCSHGYLHAFVIDASEEMATVVWDWLKPHLHKITE